MSLPEEIHPPAEEAPRPLFPPRIILLILVMAVMVGGMIGSGLAFGLGQLWNVDPQEALRGVSEDSPRSLRDYVRWANFCNHLFTFTVAALAVAWFAFRRSMWSELRLDKGPEGGNLAGGIAFIIFAFPVAQMVYWVNQQLPLPDWVWEIEDSAEVMIRGLLVMESPGELALNLLVVAVLPAIGEELVFRGLVQQQLERFWGKALPAIWITAILFSAIHLQFAGFLPRVVLGAVLGYLFYWTRNLWIPILAHFVTNGMQVLAQYLAGDKLSEVNLEQTDHVNWAAGLFSLVLLVGAGYYLKTRNFK